MKQTSFLHQCLSLAGGSGKPGPDGCEVTVCPGEDETRRVSALEAVTRMKQTSFLHQCLSLAGGTLSRVLMDVKSLFAPEKMKRAGFRHWRL